jgi:hypothetical protein
MIDNKLINILRKLDKTEFKGFGKFLESPHFNNSSMNVRFYSFLKNYYPDFNSGKFTKENLFMYLYPNEKYDDKKTRDRFTHMLSSVKCYLAQLEYDELKFDYEANLLQACLKRGILNIFEEEWQNAKSRLENIKLKDENYYLNKYLLELLNRKYVDNYVPIGKRDKLYKESSTEIDNVISFFFIVMLKEYSRVFDSQTQIKFDYKFKFFEEILTYLKKEDENYRDILLINVLYNFLLLNREQKDIKTVLKLRDQINNNRESLSAEVYKNLYIELYNYCKKQESSGKKDFGKISFQILADMLLKGALFKDDGSLSGHTYINVVASALRENEIGWAEVFIEEYKNFLNEEERENAYNYNFAVLYYMKGYDKNENIKKEYYDIAMGYLGRVKSEDFYYMTRIKNHSLKIYYELNYFDSAISLIDSYNHYLSRNKQIPPHLYERYYNFITYLSRIIKYNLNEDNESLGLLRKEITANTKTEYKTWLLDRINYLT